GNPEHPEVMWQLSEAIDGMAEACRALDVPVVGGNVSLYNASAGRDIAPTPVVGTVGLIDRLDRPPPGPTLVGGAPLLLLGPSGAAGDDALPPIDLALHRRLLDVVVGLVAAALVAGVHDVADGGLGLTLAEMAVGSGVGFRVSGVRSPAELFSEG